MVVQRVTKIEAVNAMLRGIGQQPVNSLGGNESPDVAIAEATLDEVSREVQGEGWNFNYEEDVVLNPNASNEVLAPVNAAEMDVERWNTPSTSGTEIPNWTLREGKLYDVANHTFTFPTSVTQVKVSILYLYEFKDLPLTWQDYVKVKASREFQREVQGDSARFQMSAEKEARARANAVRGDLRSGDRGFLQNNAIARRVRRQSPLNWIDRR